MKVSLVYPRALNLVFPPLGVLYIAAVLKKEGHEVMVSDIDRRNRQTIINTIKVFNPSLIGVSIISTIQINFAGELIKQLKFLLPHAHLVCGGIHSTVFACSMLEEFDVDSVVLGEGEFIIKELVRALEKNGDLTQVRGICFKHHGKIVENERREFIQDLDEIPLPARKLVDFERYLSPPGVLRGVWLKHSTTIITGRGCPAHCIYCGSHLLFGRRLRRRSVDNVISEIKLLIRDYHIDGIWFVDDTFTLDKSWVIEFTNRLRAEHIDIKWGAQARVNPVDLEMLKAMKSAGCLQLDFGVESGSLRVLKALRKGVTPDMVKNAFALTKKAGIRSLATFMIGNPEETLEDIEKTLVLAKQIKADFTIFFFTTAYPGTELFDMAVKNNWLRDKDYSKWFVREAPALGIKFTRKKLVKIRSRLQNKFMIKNIISSVRNPEFLRNIVIFSALNLPAFMAAFKIFMKTHNFDDFVFNFVEKASSKK